MKKVAVVTGSNKGIGYEIVRKLATDLHPQDEWVVYLTSRNEAQGRESLDKLKMPNVAYHKLDVCNAESRAQLVNDLKAQHPSGVNIWINNAGVAFKNDATESFGEQAKVTNETNYFATTKMMLEALPIMAAESNLVNIASVAGVKALKKMSEEVYQRVMSAESIDALDACIREFNECASDEAKLAQSGWPATAYGVSKMAITKASAIVGKQATQDLTRKVLVIACCPGWVNTDMSSHMGPLRVEQGAINPVFCATTRDVSFQGQFVSGRKLVPWNRDSNEDFVTSMED